MLMYVGNKPAFGCTKCLENAAVLVKAGVAEKTAATFAKASTINCCRHVDGAEILAGDLANPDFLARTVEMLKICKKTAISLLTCNNHYTK